MYAVWIWESENVPIRPEAAVPSCFIKSVQFLKPFFVTLARNYVQTVNGAPFHRSLFGDASLYGWLAPGQKIYGRAGAQSVFRYLWFSSGRDFPCQRKTMETQKLHPPPWIFPRGATLPRQAATSGKDLWKGASFMVSAALPLAGKSLAWERPGCLQPWQGFLVPWPRPDRTLCWVASMPCTPWCNSTGPVRW